jgi:glycerophosphoryl diester phosphodiesterase
MVMNRVEIIAHRGASHDAPENTLAAFHLGWAQGADAAECDVHLSRDGWVMVIHDATTTRTACKRAAVARQTAATLQQLDAGSWKGSRWRGERIPLLAEVLDTVPRGKRFFVEIKSGPGTVEPVRQVIRASRVGEAGVAIIGFDFGAMAFAKRTMPRVPVYWGLEAVRRPRGKLVWPRPVDEVIQLARHAGFDGLDVDATGPIDAAFANALREAGLGLFVWTVNDADTGSRLLAAGVDGITTDRPGWLRKQLNRA